VKLFQKQPTWQENIYPLWHIFLSSEQCIEIGGNDRKNKELLEPCQYFSKISRQFFSNFLGSPGMKNHSKHATFK